MKYNSKDVKEFLKGQYLVELQAFKVWFYRSGNLDEGPVRETHVIVNQVDSNAIGIQAGNILTLSYGIFAQVIYIF